MSAPIKNTCPDIDSVLDGIADAQNNLKGLDQILEKLREDNYTLRHWGTDQEDRANEFENEVDRLNTKIINLEQDLHDCQQTIEEFQNIQN